MKVWWTCLQCRHEWYGVAPEERVPAGWHITRSGRLRYRKVYPRCRKCGSYNVKPGLGDLKWTDVRQMALERDESKCQRCGVTGMRLNVHHKVPISRGGTSELDNLITLCWNCHLVKHGNVGAILRDISRKTGYPVWAIEVFLVAAIVVLVLACCTLFYVSTLVSH